MGYVTILFLSTALVGTLLLVLPSASNAVIPSTCVGETVAREHIGFSLSPHGFSHSSFLPTIRASPLSECASLLPSWDGGNSMDNAANSLTIQTTGRYLIRAWGSWDGMTGAVLDHSGGVECYRPSNASFNERLSYSLGTKKITHFEGSRYMILQVGDKCKFMMYVYWATYPGSEQASGGMEFELVELLTTPSPTKPPSGRPSPNPSTLPSSLPSISPTKTTSNFPTTSPEYPPIRVLRVSTGGNVTCALLEYEQIKCFGLGTFGQLGSGNTQNIGDSPNEMGNAIPNVDLGFDFVSSVSVGAKHVCATSNKGELKCWGSGLNGELGMANGVGSTIGDNPNEMGVNLGVVKVGLSVTVKQVSAGDGFTCVLLGSSYVKCFGLGSSGQLGHGSTSSIGLYVGSMGDNLSVVDLGTNRTAMRICTGAAHTCALLDDATVKCWGEGSFGQLGHGSTTILGDQPGELGDTLQPVNLGTNRSALLIACGDYHTCVVLNDRSVKCFGLNDKGQLGIGSTSNRGTNPAHMGDNLPTVALGRPVLSVTSGGKVTCALLDNHSVQCWGEGANGQLLRGSTSNIGEVSVLSPINFGLNPDPIAINVGAKHACGIFASSSPGTLYCWGNGRFGQRGSGDTTIFGDDLAESSASTLSPVQLGTQDLSLIPELFTKNTTDISFSKFCLPAMNSSKASKCQVVSVSAWTVLSSKRLKLQFEESDKLQVLINSPLPKFFEHPSKNSTAVLYYLQGDLTKYGHLFVVDPFANTVFGSIQGQDGSWFVQPCASNERSLSFSSGRSCHTWFFSPINGMNDSCETGNEPSNQTVTVTPRALNVTLNLSRDNISAPEPFSLSTFVSGYIDGKWDGDVVCKNGKLSVDRFYCCENLCVDPKQCMPVDDGKDCHNDPCCGVVDDQRSCRDFPPPCSMKSIQHIGIFFTARALALANADVDFHGAHNMIDWIKIMGDAAFLSSRIPIQFKIIYPKFVPIKAAVTTEMDSNTDLGPDLDVLISKFQSQDLAAKTRLGERVFYVLIYDETYRDAQNRQIGAGSVENIGCKSGIGLCVAVDGFWYAKNVYSVSHEIGHLQGGRHNRGEDDEPGYMHGYLKPTIFRTIMSYPSDNGQEPRRRFFSNPDNPSPDDQDPNGIPLPTGTRDRENAALYILERRYNNAEPKTLAASCGDNYIVGMYWTAHKVNEEVRYLTNVGLICWYGYYPVYPYLSQPMFGVENSDVVAPTFTDSRLCTLSYVFPLLTFVKGFHIEHGMVQTETGDWVETPCRINIRCQSTLGDYWEQAIEFGPCVQVGGKSTHCVDSYCFIAANTLEAAADSVFFQEPNNAVVPGVMRRIECKGNRDEVNPPLPRPSGCGNGGIVGQSSDVASTLSSGILGILSGLAAVVGVVVVLAKRKTRKRTTPTLKLSSPQSNPEPVIIPHDGDSEIRASTFVEGKSPRCGFWQETVDKESNRTYWINSATGAFSWTNPL